MLVNNNLRWTFHYKRLLCRIGLCALMPLAIAHGMDQANGTQVVAQAGSYTMTAQNLSDILALNSLVLQTPLSSAEEQEVRQILLEQFQKNPSALSAGSDKMRRLAEVARHGSLYERSELGSYLWCTWSNSASGNPLTARWVSIIKAHNPAIVSDGQYVVTQLQLNALFASNDWVAGVAGQPLSTPESRARFIQQVQAQFASMPLQAKENLAHADQRWAAFEGFILNDSGLHEKAVSLVHQNVHGPADVAKEARTLENSGVQFLAMTNDMSKRTQMLIGGLSGRAQANNLSVFNHTMAPH
ncbi:hypothetical protein [Silvibacterium acidisoli]|uniref:hypothetical protein n=1 Tax=Acidobacteriaceae bacterium ZG23-2 TaxID=2883246 RepID=UPI00406CB279